MTAIAPRTLSNLTHSGSFGCSLRIRATSAGFMPLWFTLRTVASHVPLEFLVPSTAHDINLVCSGVVERAHTSLTITEAGYPEILLLWVYKRNEGSRTTHAAQDREIVGVCGTVDDGLDLLVCEGGEGCFIREELCDSVGKGLIDILDRRLQKGGDGRGCKGCAACIGQSLRESSVN